MDLSKYTFCNDLVYSPSFGKYALLKDGCIVKIHGWSNGVKPQEMHFTWRGKKQWAYISDIVLFDDSKHDLRVVRRRLKRLVQI